MGREFFTSCDDTLISRPILRSYVMTQPAQLMVAATLGAAARVMNRPGDAEDFCDQICQSCTSESALVQRG
jgi:hypothetical protein